MSGKSLPWLPWFHRDFLAATQGWTLLERGAYFMLLNASWEMGPLPNEPRRLAGIIGAQLGEFELVWPVIAKKFQITESGLVNARLEALRAKQLDKVEKARAAANTRHRHTGETADAHTDAHANGHAGALRPDMRSGSGSKS